TSFSSPYDYDYRFDTIYAQRTVYVTVQSPGTVLFSDPVSHTQFALSYWEGESEAENNYFYGEVPFYALRFSLTGDSIRAIDGYITASMYGSGTLWAGHKVH
ncbi:MAG TPA: hypothetical protein VG603_16110, partial [Chitinophagales bacterium]|nr:hypothetical protein [Chitinophagales bacterium]